MISFSTDEVKHILMKPIELTNVVNGIVSLKTANIINQTTADSVVNTMFTDIQSGNTFVLINEIDALESNLHTYSNYLYKVTDEINSEIGVAGANTARLNELKTELNYVFDLMNSSYAIAGLIKQNNDNMIADFFDTNATYKLNYENGYANIGTSIYNESNIDIMVSNIFIAESQLDNNTHELERLSNTYSAVIEPMLTPAVATYLPQQIWITTSNDDTTPTLSVFTDSYYVTGLGSNLGENSLLVKTGAGQPSYTIHFEDTTNSNIELRIVGQAGEENIISSGSSIPLVGSLLRSFVPKNIGVNNTILTVNNSGANSVINITV